MFCDSTINRFNRGFVHSGLIYLEDPRKIPVHREGFVRAQIHKVGFIRGCLKCGFIPEPALVEELCQFSTIVYTNVVKSMIYGVNEFCRYEYAFVGDFLGQDDDPEHELVMKSLEEFQVDGVHTARGLETMTSLGLNLADNMYTPVVGANVIDLDMFVRTDILGEDGTKEFKPERLGSLRCICKILEKSNICLSGIDPGDVTEPSYRTTVQSHFFRLGRLNQCNFDDLEEVLKVACDISRGDISLTKPVNFLKFNSEQRRRFKRAIVDLLKRDRGFASYRGKWKQFLVAIGATETDGLLGDAVRELFNGNVPKKGRPRRKRRRSGIKPRKNNSRHKAHRNYSGERRNNFHKK